MQTHLSGTEGVLLFLAFTAAFAVKAPLFPLHTWSPDAYTEAPEEGSVVLSGVLAKIGTYGIIRFDLSLFPHATRVLAPLVLTLAVIGIVYGAIVACAQRDMKRLVTYSSLAQIGFIALGTLALSSQGLAGGVLLMLNHGLIVGALFILIGFIYERRGTWQTGEMRGLQKAAPVMAAVFTVVMMASIGVPGLNGFVSEFLVLSGTFITHRWWAVVAVLGVIVAAIYLLWAYQQVFHGKPREADEKTRDLALLERAVMAPLIILIVFLGVYPKPVLDRINPSVKQLIAHVESSTGQTQPSVAVERCGGREVIATLLATTHAASASDTIAVPPIRWLAILPPIILIGGAVLLLGLASLVSRPLKVAVSTVATVVISGGALGVAIWQWTDVQDHGAHTYIKQAVVMDGFSVFITMLVAIAMLLTALVADGYLRREGVQGVEFHVLAMVSASGAMLMAMANDLIIIFLGLEILSIALYVLTAFNYKRAASGEAALKYFILGGFSSAIFVYGIALTYGATGSTNLTQIGDFLSKNVVLSNGLLLAGLALLLVGFGFKVAAVPFHMWTPDVYQGAPSPVTGFMAAVAKAGAFAAMLRVLFSAFGVVSTDWRPIIYGLAVLSLVLGAFVALRQRDVKRMLAYSSINHAGFILLGVVAGTARGASASLYYLFAYMLMTIGSFAIVTVLGRDGDADHDLSRYRGLAGRQPVLALAFAVLLLAQAGAPFTTGLWAKLQVVFAVIDSGSVPAGLSSGTAIPLAAIAMVTAVVAAYFYLRVAVLMYSGGGLGEPEGGTSGSGELSRGSAMKAGGLIEMAEPAGVELATAQDWGSPAAVSSGVTTLNEQIILADEGAATEPEPVDVPVLGAIAIGLCTGVTVLFGFWPQPLIDFANHATLLFLPH